MPELPEVATIKSDLEKVILNKEIIAVEINNSKVIKEPAPAEFKKGILGQSVKEIIRKGKLLVFKLQEDKFLIIHLRINGWLKFGEKDQTARVIFGLKGGRFLNYIDSRLLGQLQLRKGYQDLEFVRKLGPEIFDLKVNQFQKKVEKKNANIKGLIMDQHFLAGLGNIYAQEALFLSGIDPRRRANSLSASEAGKLYRAIKSVLEAGIKNRGSSVDAYRDLEGNKGGMEKKLKIYQKNKEKCCRCNGKVEKIKIAGRGTCFCSACQK